MRLNLSSQIDIQPVHGENAWLKGDIEWTPRLLRSALAWLSEKTGKSLLKLTDKDYSENGLDQLQEIVLQHINHPSVAMWGLFAHLWSRGDSVVPYLRRLNERAHALDPSRPRWPAAIRTAI